MGRSIEPLLSFLNSPHNPSQTQATKACCRDNGWKRGTIQGLSITLLSLTLLYISLSPGTLWAATVTTNGCTPANMQTAMNAAVSGTDTVKMTQANGVSACASPNNWSSAVSTTKGLTLDGNGSFITRTFTSTPLFTITTHATHPLRITNFRFVQTQSCCPGSDTDNNAILIDGSTTNALMRIDNNTFSSSTSSVLLNVRGSQYGVIDHNTFSAADNAEHIHIRGNGGSGWTTDVRPGSANAIYVEDNTFTNSGSSNANSSLQSYDGARTVYRYNTMNNTQVDQHGTAGQIGARWFEIYENRFNNGGAGTASDKFADLRAGSGVVFNNHLIAGSVPIYLREENSGAWPVAYQIGSGYNGGTDGHATCAGPFNQSPVYSWNNDMSTSIHFSNSGSITLNVDYFVSASQPATMRRMQLSTDTCSTTYTYTPYTYPHPLVTGSDVSTPAAPTGLTVK